MSPDASPVGDDGFCYDESGLPASPGRPHPYRSIRRPSTTHHPTDLVRMACISPLALMRNSRTRRRSPKDRPFPPENPE
jgi:hypothetical protein